MSLEHPPLPPDDLPFDDDNPEWTEETFARAAPVDDLPPQLQAAILAAVPRTKLRGQQKAPTKAQVTQRLDRDILDLPRHRDGLAIQYQCGLAGNDRRETGVRCIGGDVLSIISGVGSTLVAWG